MLGDMYCGTVTYGRNNSAEPALLGSIEVRYSPVTAFTGGSAKNSLNKDIVTGLNTSDSEAGYLMLSPSLLVLDDEAHLQWQNGGGHSQEMTWRRLLRPTLEPVAIPRYWRVIDEMPVNSMNKRVYAQLQELFHEAP